MITANISQTKNELSRYLDAVRGGETVVILDRNRPIACLKPLSAEEGEGLSSHLSSLEAAGLMRRPEKRKRLWPNGLLPVGETQSEPVGSVSALLEERSEAR